MFSSPAMKSSICLLAALAACGSSSNQSTTNDANPGGGDGAHHVDGATNGADGAVVTTGRTIFVIPMENESASAIYGNASAPYINNTLMAQAATASAFSDELPSAVPSEPHYVWMEAGTNAFSDRTFLTDVDPSATNSTSSTDHLVTQLKAANLGWMSYQEGITAGTCPTASISGTFYAAKHDPFVFFQDVAGATPSASNAYCAAHHKPYSAFAADLSAGTMPPFVFITPNLCHDMHGASGCPSGTAVAANIAAGDTWLSTELPAILTYASTHNSVVYLIWDEGSSNATIPFLAFSPHIKTGSSSMAFTHSSMLKSIDEQLGVPVLPSVTSANDFSTLFQSGAF